MLDFTTVKIEYREAVEDICRKAGIRRMSHSFDTLYLWQQPMDLVIHLEDDFFVAQARAYGPADYFFPCGNVLKCVNFINEYKSLPGFTLHYMGEKDVEFLNEHFPQEFNVEYDRGSCEYLFERKAYEAMEGKNYERLRHDIHKLQKKCSLRSEVLGTEHFDAAMGIIDEWIDERGNLHEDEINDNIVAKKIISEWENLNFYGVIIYKDEEPWAVAAGGRVAHDTVCIQLAKARAAETGMMFYLLKEMFESLPEDITIINGDDDLGHEGIRLMKQRMRPMGFEEIWKASLNER